MALLWLRYMLTTVAEILVSAKMNDDREMTVIKTVVKIYGY